MHRTDFSVQSGSVFFFTQPVAKPRKTEKVGGMPKSVMVMPGAAHARALRAKRSGQERRECARSARERNCGEGVGSACPVGPICTSTRWLRRNCMQARRCVRRLQSRQRSGSLPTLRGCEPHADLTRLFGGTTLPLTLVAQRTGTTTADAGTIHDAQASIGFVSAVHAGSASVQQGTAASHRAGGQRRVLRSDQLSRTIPAARGA